MLGDYTRDTIRDTWGILDTELVVPPHVRSTVTLIL